MRVYLSPSQQQHNVGVGAYGTEAKRCQDIADRVRRRLKAAGLEVKQTPRSWEPLEGNTWLAKVVKASNDWHADAHVCIHTNAASSSAVHGTDAWYYPGSVKGKALTQAIYSRVVKVSGKGNGLHTSPLFYETRAAKAPVAYMELVYHTNKSDVQLVIDRPGDFADAIADGICAWAGVKPASAEPASKLVTAKQRPVLKQRMLTYALTHDVMFDGAERLILIDPDGTPNTAWGKQAMRLAWRVSGRLPGVVQTSQPTVELLRALGG